MAYNYNSSVQSIFDSRASQLAGGNQWDIVKDFLSRFFMDKDYKSLPSEYQFIGDQLIKILQNQFGDVLGFDNRAADMGRIHQGILASGGIPLIDKNNKAVGTAYGAGAASIEMAVQLENMLHTLTYTEEGRRKTDTFGTMDTKTSAGMLAQVVKERGFKQGDIIDYTYEPGSEGISKGIKRLKELGVAEDDPVLKDAYRMRAITKQREIIEAEFNKNVDEGKIKVEGKIISAKEAYEELNALRQEADKAKENKTQLSADKVKRMETLTESLPELEINGQRFNIKAVKDQIDALKKKGDELTQDELTRLRILTDYYDQAKENYTAQDLKESKIIVKDENGKEIDTIESVNTDDIKLSQLGVKGGVHVVGMSESAKKDMEDVIKLARDNVEQLMNILNTKDFNELQQVATELKWGSLTKRENVAKVRAHINDAAVTAVTSGREIKEVLAEQAELITTLSQVYSSTDNINPSIITAIQRKSNIGKSNWENGGLVTPDQQKAAEVASNANMLNYNKQELLFKGITQNEQFDGAWKNDPEAVKEKEEIDKLYELANNATTREEYEMYKQQADQKVAEFVQKYFYYLNQVTKQNIVEQTLTQKEVDRFNEVQNRLNITDMFKAAPKGSSIDEAGKKFAGNDNWKEQTAKELGDVYSLFGGDLKQYNKLKAVASDDAKYEKFKENIINTFKEQGASDEKIEQVTRTLDRGRDLFANKDYEALAAAFLSYIPNSGIGVYRGELAILNEKNTEIETIKQNMLQRQAVPAVDGIDALIQAYVGGVMPTYAQITDHWVRNLSNFEQKGLITKDENGRIKWNKDINDSEDEDTKNIMYLEMDDEEALRNNEKLAEFLNIDKEQLSKMSRNDIIKAMNDKAAATSAYVTRSGNNDDAFVIIYGQEDKYEQAVTNDEVVKNRVAEEQKEAQQNQNNEEIDVSNPKEVVSSSLISGIAEAIPNINMLNDWTGALDEMGLGPIETIADLEKATKNKDFKALLKDKLGLNAEGINTIQAQTQSAIDIVKSKGGDIEQLDAKQLFNIVTNLAAKGKLSEEEQKSLTKVEKGATSTKEDIKNALEKSASTYNKLNEEKETDKVKQDKKAKPKQSDTTAAADTKDAVSEPVDETSSTKQNDSPAVVDEDKPGVINYIAQAAQTGVAKGMRLLLGKKPKKEASAIEQSDKMRQPADTATPTTQEAQGVAYLNEFTNKIINLVAPNAEMKERVLTGLAADQNVYTAYNNDDTYISNTTSTDNYNSIAQTTTDISKMLERLDKIERNTAQFTSVLSATSDGRSLSVRTV